MSSEIIIGQLGCGGRGPNLLRAFSSLRGGRVKWLAEIDAERRAYATSHFPEVTVTGDWKAVLADPQVQAVLIATPPATHFELTRAALSAGKHVLVEKPLTTRTAEADELRRLATLKKRVLMVGHTFLYNKAIHFLKDLIDRRELGDIRYFQTQRRNLDPVRDEVNTWWNLAPHDVSLLLYLMSGEMPVSVSAPGMSDSKDAAFATLVWKGGASAHLHALRESGPVRALTVVGSQKTAVYDDTSEDQVRIYEGGVPENGMPFDEKNRSRAGGFWLPKIDLEEPLKVQISHFLDCVRTGKEPVSGPEHARNIVEILEAGQEALQSGVTRGFGTPFRKVG